MMTCSTLHRPWVYHFVADIGPLSHAQPARRRLRLCQYVLPPLFLKMVAGRSELVAATVQMMKADGYF